MKKLSIIIALVIFSSSVTFSQSHKTKKVRTESDDKSITEEYSVRKIDHKIKEGEYIKGTSIN